MTRQSQSLEIRDTLVRVVRITRTPVTAARPYNVAEILSIAPVSLGAFDPSSGQMPGLTCRVGRHSVEYKFVCADGKKGVSNGGVCVTPTYLPVRHCNWDTTAMRPAPELLEPLRGGGTCNSPDALEHPYNRATSSTTNSYILA